MLERIRRLDQALGMWEDAMFHHAMSAKYRKKINAEETYPLTKNMENWGKLRLALLNAKPYEYIDTERFIFDNQFVEKFPEFKSLNLMAHSLITWTGASRRVYQLSREIASLLSITSLVKTRWRDILMPFGCFAIQLEKPIIADNTSWDFLIAYNLTDPEKNQPEIAVQLYSTEMDKYEAMTDNDKQDIQNVFNQNKLDRFYSKFSRASQKVNRVQNFSSIIFLTGDSYDSLVEGSIEEAYKKGMATLEGQPVPLLDLRCISRLVFALCIYLSNINTDESKEPRKYVDDWTGLPRKEKQKYIKSISSEALVCHVTSSITITSEQLELIERGDQKTIRALSPHFRKAHKRRPRGKGKVFGYPKTVKVKKTFVLKNKLPDGHLAGGAVHKIR